MKEKCLDVLYPPRCPACGGILEDKQRSICPQCESIFHPVSEYYCMKCGKPVNETEEYCSECQHRERKFIRGRSVFLYNAQMKNSLLRYKYYGSREYGKYYAESMCRYVGRDIKSWKPDVIIPVPLHRRKKRMRGFNQAADLAERIGKILGIPVAEDVIYKSRETRSQKKLDAEERKKNLRNAFQAAGPVTGLRILVVDDVYTTGSTVEAHMARAAKGSNSFFMTFSLMPVQAQHVHTLKQGRKDSPFMNRFCALFLRMSMSCFRVTYPHLLPECPERRRQSPLPCR